MLLYMADEEDFLAGLCEFPAEVNNKPSQITISNPFITVDDLIKSVIVKTSEGIQELPYPTETTGKILGFRKDLDALQILGKEGIHFSSPANPTKLLTAEQWTEEFGTDPFPIIFAMRTWWKNMGGGVQTTIPNKKVVEYFKLGKK